MTAFVCPVSSCPRVPCVLVSSCPACGPRVVLAQVMRCISPDLQSMRSALLNAGYRVSQSHTDPLAIKTDAPQEFVWDVLKAWMETHPVRTVRPTHLT